MAAVILLGAPVLVLLAVVVHGFLARPTFRRLAVRNATRRPGEAALVVFGSMLGTAIITSSFIVGDTLDRSIRDVARTSQGPIDQLVRVSDLGRLDAVVAVLAEPPLPETDGLLAAVRAEVTVATPAPDRRAEPSSALVEVDFDEARAFGGDPRATGLDRAGPTPGPGEAVIGDDLARTLRVGPGDRIDAFLYGTTVPLTVRTTVPKVGLAGRGGSGTTDGTAVFVAPGTIVAAFRSSTVATAAPPSGEVYVSNRGGVFSGVDRTAVVTAAIRDRLGAAGIEVDEVATVKQDTLEDAAAAGRQFTQLFSGIGGFSVIAGILLLVNLFVMLAEERKVQLGVLRAVGLKRNHLVRTFAMEGAVYAVLAGLLGGVAGIGVGWIIARVSARIFEAGGASFTIRFAFQADSLVVGVLIGLAISLVTIFLTSLRVSRLNVIRAIRDLPEPVSARRRARSAVLGLAGVVMGSMVFVTGVATGSQVPALAGPAIVAFSSIPLWRRVLPGRWAVTVPCTAALVWGIAVFSALPGVMRNSAIPVFVVQGVVLVGAAVTLLAANGDQLGRLGHGRNLAARLGLAYPLSRPVRTGLLLGMYAIVIFTLTFLAVFSELFARQGPRFTEEIRAGYDVLVTSSPTNPVTVEQLEAEPGIAAAAPLRRGFPRFTASFEPEPTFWALSGFDDRLLVRGVPVLRSRLDRFPTDEAAWRAVLTDPTLAMVPSFFLQQGGPPTGEVAPGETIGVIDPASGRTSELTVAGVIESDWLFNGVMVGDPFARGFLGPLAVVNRHYVAPLAGQDPGALADALTGRLIDHGVDARTFRSIVDESLAGNRSFFGLMQGFLALGLLIGIAGLGVVMVRAVRERRRQIGMLRAMGFPGPTVRRAFLVEAAFVATQGIVIGLGLGLVTAWQLLTASETFGRLGLGFAVPWGALAVIAVAPLAFSLLAVAVPATQASRIPPAVALRIAE